MLVYPVESIFAEKLETIVSKGSNNSRMKDYHDIVWTLAIFEKLYNKPSLRALAKQSSVESY